MCRECLPYLGSRRLGVGLGLAFDFLQVRVGVRVRVRVTGFRGGRGSRPTARVRVRVRVRVAVRVDGPEGSAEQRRCLRLGESEMKIVRGTAATAMAGYDYLDWGFGDNRFVEELSNPDGETAPGGSEAREKMPGKGDGRKRKEGPRTPNVGSTTFRPT